MPLPHYVVIPVALVCLWLTGCDKSSKPRETVTGEAGFPEFVDPHLQDGKKVWMANCKACHGYGIAGAPRITERAAWQARIAQGRKVLYQHAVEGFFGEMGTQMPARGGNDALSDSEVIAAVDYMVAASQ